jgi:hypothetical protein
MQHNEHKDYYQSVEGYIKENPNMNWVSKAEMENAIETDDMWAVQWYPDTPIGFYWVAACSLEALLLWCLEWRKEHERPAAGI